ncbi:hypothetical protein [Draconibacterium sediminis]|uniref:Uncharacterized protein n=1 Tax=Draconibacterium sediminis TaxID=1544798 RepID=A0A0D8JBC5_9BACT|nr:hypothetical protein [Draconibacterium sediminis]KJF43118.1 hypothetical protein LH29_17220 [Draconibacterium sediminis]
MKQELEKYLKEQRLKLDVEESEPDIVWEGIRNQLHQNKKQNLPQWFWKVAAIFLFVVSATYFVVNETSDKQMVIVQLSDISEELGNKEASLQKVVNAKWEMVEQELPENNSEIQFLLNELKSLDQIYATYQKDLNNTIDNEPVIHVLLDYYEKKIKVLNRILLEIEKQENHEKTITL